MTSPHAVGPQTDPFDVIRPLGPRAAALIERLGYTAPTGWIDGAEFDALATPRFALRQARDEMSVVGAFCLKREGQVGASVTPLVYVATTAEEDAREVHRRVWSQGLAPFLLVLTPGGVILCRGFSFTHDRWEQHVRRFPWAALNDLPRDPLATVAVDSPVAELWDMRAIRLRASLFWRDRSLSADTRVDQRLLGGMRALSTLLLAGRGGVSRPLSPAATNGLVGRFLYVFFLVDRGIIGQDWVADRGHSGIDLTTIGRRWPAAATMRLFDDLDAVFNGSIFPLGRKERREVDDSHIDLVRRVMRHGAMPAGSAGLQLGLFDIHFGALRTETLSAVYEQLFENVGEDERRRAAAFYTPPFVVDFMLDRVEELAAFEDGGTLLDPSAGSGVFLVGAYRRIVERALAARPGRSLTLDELRGLLERNVFGIERNLDACHVAAFSLYLTMLDYVAPRDLRRIAAGKEATKLFPELVGRNLFAEDFFSARDRFPGLPERIRFVIGNPPWKPSTGLASKAADRWREAHAKTAPTGRGQAAELFTWKALREHLQEGGVLGLLVPAKSFVNSSSEAFRRALGRELTVAGAANFAHLRYRLFAGARQAAAALFGRRHAPAPRHRTWIYSPFSVGQPMAPKERPWTLILDRADLQSFEQASLQREPRGWFEAFMLRPVDRQIRRYLDDAAAEGRIALLGDLCSRVGARIRRGGNEAETGISRRFLLDAPSTPLEDDLFGARQRASLEDGGQLARLPPEVLARAKGAYGAAFRGNILLVPRNLADVRFVGHPVGYTSSILAVYFEEADAAASRRGKALLRALGRVLSSRAALYLVATTGRRWLMDRRNIEPLDLAELPVPLTGLDDERTEELLAREGAELDAFVLQALGIRGGSAAAVQEFLRFRMRFQDGDVPPDAVEPPRDRSLGAYGAALARTLDGLLGRRGAFAVKVRPDPAAGVAAVVAQYQAEGSTAAPELDGLCDAALRRWLASPASSFLDSLCPTLDAGAGSVACIKPLERFRWTLDGAFADGRRIAELIAERP